MTPKSPTDPASDHVRHRLFPPRADAVIADPDLPSRLRERLADQLAGIAYRPEILGPSITVSKEKLASVHACQRNFMETWNQPWTWTVPTVTGKVAHEAIRLRLTGGLLARDEHLVAHTVDYLAADGTDQSLADFLTGLSPIARADLISETCRSVHCFIEACPRPTPKPVVAERPRSVRLLDDRVRVAGTVDLEFDQPRRTDEGVERRRLLLELKTGSEALLEHRPNLHLYGLLDTLVTRIAPVRLAVWYLAPNEVYAEDLHEPALEAAADRLADGIRKIIGLLTGAVEPTEQAGWRCRFCPALDRCETGSDHVRRSAWTSSADPEHAG